jgi:hypothetical protein
VAGAGHGRRAVVHGYPLRTGDDRCEWHASGTAGEDDATGGDAVGSNLDPWVRPTLGGHGLDGKPLKTARQVRSRPAADAIGGLILRTRASSAGWTQ